MNRCLLFDLDNTLVDRDAAMGRFAAQWCVTDEVRAELLASDAGGQGCRESFAALLNVHVPREARWTPGSIAKEIALQVMPNEAIIAMLGRLRTRYRLGLVTNGGSCSQREKLRRARISEFFSVVCISGECGAAKPAPQMFERALRELDCAPGDAIVVGDSLRCDIEGAAALGIPSCWVDAELRSHPAATMTIRIVLDLETYLAAQEAAA